MPANITTVAGAAARDLFLNNYNYADAVSGMESLKFCLIADQATLGWKTAAGTMYKALKDGTGATGLTANRLIVSDTVGSVIDSERFTHDPSTGATGITGDLAVVGTVTASNLNVASWNGAVAVSHTHANKTTLDNINQELSTTSSVTFATVNTGQGATEVHLMNQNLRTSDSVVFTGARLTAIDTGLTNDVAIVAADGTLQKRAIDSRVWGSSLVAGSSLSNNTVPRYNGTALVNTAITDDGSTVAIGRNTTLGSNSSNSHVVNGTLTTTNKLTVNSGGTMASFLGSQSQINLNGANATPLIHTSAGKGLSFGVNGTTEALLLTSTLGCEIKGNTTLGSSSTNLHTTNGYMTINRGTGSDALKAIATSNLTTTRVAEFLNLYNNFDTDPTTSYPIIKLARSGKSGISFSSTASFDIARWENNGSNARSELDIKLSHGETSNGDMTALKLRSDGSVYTYGNTTLGSNWETNTHTLTGPTVTQNGFSDSVVTHIIKNNSFAGESKLSLQSYDGTDRVFLKHDPFDGGSQGGILQYYNKFTIKHNDYGTVSDIIQLNHDGQSPIALKKTTTINGQVFADKSISMTGIPTVTINSTYSPTTIEYNAINIKNTAASGVTVNLPTSPANGMIVCIGCASDSTSYIHINDGGTVDPDVFPGAAVTYVAMPGYWWALDR